MIRISLPDNHPRRLAFFLALEEWVAMNMPEGEYFFTWNVQPTVIIGRNQDINAEVNIDYCKKHDIEVVRRRSGGGCVYADRDNIMMSYICAETNVEFTFAHYTSMVAAQLQKMGINAVPSGRNDITVGDRKISGNAFYLLPGRSIVHGTMLFDTNLENMLNAITPSKAKLESHQVKSVEARITMVSRLMPGLTFEKFHNDLVEGLETGVKNLAADEIAEVEALEKRYYDPEWLFGAKMDKLQK